MADTARAEGKRVRQGYLQMAKEEPARWIIIQAQQDVDAVGQEVQQHMDQLLVARAGRKKQRRTCAAQERSMLLPMPFSRSQSVHSILAAAVVVTSLVTSAPALAEEPQPAAPPSPCRRVAAFS